MDNLEIVKNMFDTNFIGASIIVILFAVCIVGCSMVVYDTVCDTYKTIGQLRKNKKTKN